MIAFVIRYLPLGYGAIAPNMIQISPDIESSARTAGASWLRTMVKIVMPILKPGLLAAFALFFLQFFKEYSTAVFLVSPGTEIIGTVMLNFIWEARTGEVAALAVFQVLVTTVFLLVLGLLAKVRLYD